MALVPCDSCRRHVRSAEAACPFCKAVRTVAVTAVAAFAIAGCDTFSPASKYGGPPDDYRYTPADAATPVTTAEPTPSATPSATSPRLGDSSDNGHVIAPVAKYGGPPRR